MKQGGEHINGQPVIESVPQPIRLDHSEVFNPASASSSTTAVKFISLAAALAFALTAFAQVTESLICDNKYDDPSLPITSVICGNGLTTQGYTTFGSLPTFPYIGGMASVTGWNSPVCDTCYNVTYDNTTIPILVVDTAPEGFIVSEAAMNALTGGMAIALGRIEITATEVDRSVCGIY